MDAFLSLLQRIDGLLKQGNVYLAIEGGSASGKTTLSKLLSEKYDCTVFHMDDFFLRPEQRTPERYAQIGGNVDRERFLQEVLQPLRRGEPVRYRPFDCAKMEITDGCVIEPKRLVITEGAYAMHPELAGFYNLSVFLEISPELQRERILRRNGPERAKQFFEKWIPLENAYFSGTDIQKRCDLTIQIASNKEAIL
jgi:uridine kinase